MFCEDCQERRETHLILIHWIGTLAQTSELEVLLPTSLGNFRLRLIACPLRPDQAERKRERLRKQARKKGKKVLLKTLLAAGFILVVTNLPADLWPAERVLYLNRLRWQIELQFKRMKSLLCLDHLRAQDPRLVQTYLLAKLLAAVLLDRLVQQAEEHNQQLFASLQRPVSLWRLQDLLRWGIQDCIIGPLSIYRILEALPYLSRYLRDSPRPLLRPAEKGSREMRKNLLNDHKEGCQHRFLAVTIPLNETVLDLGGEARRVVRWICFFGGTVAQISQFGAQ